MRIQVFSEYLQMAQAGKLDFLACPMHSEDKPAIFPLTHFEKNDKIVLQCLACGYKVTAGENLYSSLLHKIKMAKVENDDSKELH